jgi:acid phosphatase (class A)
MTFQNLYLKLAVAAMLLAAPGSIQAQGNAAAHPAGYLSATGIPDFLSIVPPAPAAADGRDQADRAIFRATRAAQNTPRWTLAQHDADYSVTGLFGAFACALGSAPDARSAPHLSALLARVTTDSAAAAAGVKDRYKRKRPFLVDDGPICVARDESLVNSFDYPSAHATLGWATGLILAELEPSHATALLARGRSYGDSRIFCGVHNSSAVETGRIIGAALVSALHGSSAFRKDMQAAGKELAALRKGQGTQQPSCATEAKAISESPYAIRPDVQQ